MENSMIELNEAQLNTISGGHHHSNEGNNSLNGFLGFLSALEKRSGGNLTINLSIVVVSNSYIGGNLIVNTLQVA